MKTYDRKITMEVDPDRIFDFVSDPRNLPQFLPEVKRAEKLEGDRIRLQGDSHGHSYDAEGFFRDDRHRRRIEWGAEGDHSYSGWMQIREGDASSLVSEIEMELKFAQPPADAQKILDEMGQTLQAIRDHFLRPVHS
jgi:polyketide cyclase/dehydrase/lipid transport protein